MAGASLFHRCARRPGAASRCRNLINVAAYHLPPVALGMLRRFSSLAACCAAPFRGVADDGRFYAATGFTSDQWRGADRVHPRWEELNAARHKAYAETPNYEEDDDEGERLHNERWNLAEAMMAHKPQTVVDLAWQAEAYLIADLEMLSSDVHGPDDRLIRTLFHHIRTLGALLQPDDPLGALSIDIDSDDGAEA